MAVNIEKYATLLQECNSSQATLIAVSKTKPAQDLMELYNLGQRDFGENYVQELVEKEAALPNDIRWHFIGHLQSNKAKFIAPFVHMVHGVDSLKLLKEINKQAAKAGRIVHCLLQIHIAQEETKFGMDQTELGEAINEITTSNLFNNIKVDGLMGMASFSDDGQKVTGEMQQLKKLYDKYADVVNDHCQFTILSMGMSGDYTLAMKLGSNMVRIGSLLFGARK